MDVMDYMKILYNYEDMCSERRERDSSNRNPTRECLKYYNQPAEQTLVSQKAEREDLQPLPFAKEPQMTNDGGGEEILMNEDPRE